MNVQVSIDVWVLLIFWILFREERLLWEGTPRAEGFDSEGCEQIWLMKKFFFICHHRENTSKLWYCCREMCEHNFCSSVCEAFFFCTFLITLFYCRCINVSVLFVLMYQLKYCCLTAITIVKDVFSRCAVTAFNIYEAQFWSWVAYLVLLPSLGRPIINWLQWFT